VKGSAQPGNFQRTPSRVLASKHLMPQSIPSDF
jgi:hypothetical protein